MNDWDVSQVRVFSMLFHGMPEFNEDISSWDVSGGIQFVS